MSANSPRRTADCLYAPSHLFTLVMDVTRTWVTDLHGLPRSYRTRRSAARWTSSAVAYDLFVATVPGAAVVAVVIAVAAVIAVSMLLLLLLLLLLMMTTIGVEVMNLYFSSSFCWCNNFCCCFTTFKAAAH